MWTCVLDLSFQSCVFSLCCGVFFCCDISTVTLLIRGSKELPCCFVDLEICVCTAKRTCVFDHRLTRLLLLLLLRSKAPSVVPLVRRRPAETTGKQNTSEKHAHSASASCAFQMPPWHCSLATPLEGQLLLVACCRRRCVYVFSCSSLSLVFPRLPLFFCCV